MGMAHLALRITMMLSFLVVSTQALAIELGALQAVPSSYPPYIFRLPIITPGYDPATIAAVTVRQPSDAVSFVKQNVLELRLRTLTDVELEVSQGGQTLNRLLLKSEFQTARLGLETVPASNASQLSSAKGRDRLFAEAMPLTPAPATSAAAPDGAVLERELEGIRQEVHNLVGRVIRWGEFSPPAERTGESAIPAGLTLLLGGLFIAGMTSLVIGYVMQRSALEIERRWRRALTLSIRQMQDQFAARGHSLTAVQPTPLWRSVSETLPAVTRLSRVYVSQKTRRRLRLRAARDMYAAAHAHNAEPMRLVERTFPPGNSTLAECLVALEQLRRELMRLQRSPLTSTPSPDAEAKGGRTPC